MLPDPRVRVALAIPRLGSRIFKSLISEARLSILKRSRTTPWPLVLAGCILARPRIPVQRGPLFGNEAGWARIHAASLSGGPT